MRIAQLAPLIESVPPSGYGGTELVVSHLTEQLVLRGHDVTLFASGDSLTQARLIPVVSVSLRKNQSTPSWCWPAYDLRSLLRVQELQGSFDVVHNHMGYQALPFVESLSCAVVTTNHNLVTDHCAAVYSAYRHLPFVAISEAYRSLNYPNTLNYVATIYNGIDVDKFAHDQNTNREYLLFLGRICHEKGTSVAIDISRRLGLLLVIAGKIDASDIDYFSSQIKPELSDRNIKFVGEVNECEKIRLYRGAIATLYPIGFDEPFGLVMAESLASGTPVIALNRGAVSEVLSDGETGIVASSVEEMIERFGEIRKMQAHLCRQRCRDLFGRERMAERYESLYISLTESITHSVANDKTSKRASFGLEMVAGETRR